MIESLLLLGCNVGVAFKKRFSSSWAKTFVIVMLLAASATGLLGPTYWPRPCLGLLRGMQTVFNWWSRDSVTTAPDCCALSQIGPPSLVEIMPHTCLVCQATLQPQQHTLAVFFRWDISGIFAETVWSFVSVALELVIKVCFSLYLKHSERNDLFFPVI